MPNPYRTHVFVSYSRKDSEWLERLRAVLDADRRNDRIRYWDDHELEPGDPWYQGVLKAIDHAKVAVLLVSPNFLTSRFIMEEEVPRVLKAVDDGLTVLWIPLFGTFYGPDAPCALKPIADLQAAVATSTPLADLPPESLQAALLDICHRIHRLLNPARIPPNLPFHSLGSLFKGRGEDLTWLDEQLRQIGSTGIMQAQIITGLGGIGKTRLALEYAWRHDDDFTAFLFVSANTPDDLATNLARLSEHLDLPEYRFGKQEEQYAAVLRWLQQNKGWLLILDNVDTLEGVGAVKQLVAELHGGQVLITSRINGPEWSNSAQRLPLNVIPMDDAVKFLLESTIGQHPERPDDVVQARALAEKLGCLPLALTHASAYVREYFEPFAEYSAEFDRRFAEVIEWDNPEAMEYDPQAREKLADPKEAATIRTIATTFFISFTRLEPLEKAIFHAASFLAPDSIPVAMFSDCPDETKALVSLWCEESGDSPSVKPVRDAIADLARYSLITRSDGTFSIHRIVQRILRSRMPHDRVPKWVEATRAALVRYTPDESAEDPKTWAVWDVLRPHAELMIKQAEADPRITPDLTLMNAVETLYYGKGLYEANLKLNESALRIADRIYGPESARFATQLIICGETLRALGHLIEAETLFCRSLGIREKLDGFVSGAVASALNYVALTADERGRPREAEELQRRAWDIYESMGENTDKHDLSKTLHHLGELVTRRGDRIQGEQIVRQALQACEVALGPEHPHTSACVNDLAIALARRGDLTGAESLYHRALSINEKLLGFDHPHTLAAVANLAALLRDRGDVSHAEPLCRRALAGREKVLGPDHPDTLTSVNSLAGLLMDRGDGANAETLCHHALMGRENVLGPDHPDTLTSVNDLACMLIRRGALADAEPLCQRALTGWEKVLGPDHPYTLTGVVNLAALMRDRGDLSQAEQLGRRAMETYERVVGPQAPETLEAMSSLADVLERARRNEDARMLRLRRIGLLAAQSDISPLALRGLARDCFVLGDYAKAEEILNRLVRLSFETSSTHHHLVRLYLMTDRFDEAREHVLLAWAARSDAKDYVIARLLWYKLTLVLVDTGVKTGVANEITLFLGQLKTALQREGAFQEWTMQPILDHLKLIVQEQEAGSRNWDLLCALVAALSERQNLSALNQFPVWCEALPQPLD